MHCQGVGASANESTVLPASSDHRKAGRGSRPSRKKPLRLFTSMKCGSTPPPRSATSRLRMMPPRQISADPSSSAVTVPPLCAGVPVVTSRPSARKWPRPSAT